ncbi:MAG: hemerythrin domain-containing protein [Rhodobacteraceae bacterium]|nr:hemerythrin domain-containing protein [Paracoccaceae bacterium]
MISNYRLFGNLCGQECQRLTCHHTAEDQKIFPALMQGSEGQRRVVERLMYEHTIIHALLEDLKTRAVALLQSPEQEDFTALSETFRQLAATLRSHFGDEETELEDAIGYHGIRV